MTSQSFNRVCIDGAGAIGGLRLRENGAESASPVQLSADPAQLGVQDLIRGRNDTQARSDDLIRTWR
jgi:hypothetical protein